MSQISELDGSQVGTTPAAAVNDTPQKNNQGVSSFDLSHYNGLTTRFGDVTPFLSMETVPRDTIRFSSNHELRTPTLSAPLLSPVRMHKSYFHIPMKALMPRTWDYIIENPKRGDDINDVVVYDGIGTKLGSPLPKWPLYYGIYKIIDAVKTQISKFITEDPSYEGAPLWEKSQFAGWMWYSIALLRNLCSRGSLLSTLGYPVYSTSVDGREFDVELTNLLTALFKTDSYGEGEFYSVSRKFNSSDSKPAFVLSSKDSVSLDDINGFLDDIEVNPSTHLVVSVDEIEGWFPNDVMAAISDFVDFLDSLMSAINNSAGAGCIDDTDANFAPVYYNPCKLLAYQMVCAQFFSNDNVDNIHDAKKYLENLDALFNPGDSVSHFTINGVRLSPDVPSEVFYSSMMVHVPSGSDLYNEISGQQAWMNVFCFQRSLKYGDYFNSGRTRPIGIGDTDLYVSDTGTIAAIDVTKNLAKQRFLNAVNRLGFSIAQYTKGIFGVSTDQLEPQPQFLARSTSFIGNPETTNTADEQGKLTSRLASVDGKYEFTGSFNDFGYLFGLVSFDVIPCYSRSIDPCLTHTDRFEFFNPMLQNIGDQPIQMKEINFENVLGVLPTFAYAQRFAEYKQGINRCSGAFAVAPIKGVSNGFADWLYQAGTPQVPINSAFLRHHRAEFNRFLSSVDGVGLANYVHFAIIFNLNVSASRAMQYVSTIL